jgi:hypothetical protein
LAVKKKVKTYGVAEVRSLARAAKLSGAVSKAMRVRIGIALDRIEQKPGGPDAGDTVLVRRLGEGLDALMDAVGGLATARIMGDPLDG